MFESDHDRLQLIKAAGGVVVSHDSGEFMAIFDASFELGAGDVGSEQAAPVLTCRTIDVKDLQKSAVLRLDESADKYRVLRHEPDGTGITRLVLKRS